jgi:hypothetical protein
MPLKLVSAADHREAAEGYPFTRSEKNAYTS